MLSTKNGRKERCSNFSHDTLNVLSFLAEILLNQHNCLKFGEELLSFFIEPSHDIGVRASGALSLDDITVEEKSWEQFFSLN